MAQGLLLNLYGSSHEVAVSSLALETAQKGPGRRERSSSQPNLLATVGRNLGWSLDGDKNMVQLVPMIWPTAIYSSSSVSWEARGLEAHESP